VALLSAHQVCERERLQHLVADRRGLAQHLREREPLDRTVTPGQAPGTVSVGGVIDYARCPKRFYWSSVRPLPRFSGPAARIGTEIHRWIERRSAGQGQLLEIDETPDLTAEELAGEPGRIERLRQAFNSSRFAERVPLFAERAFILRLGGFAVAGRIDAVFGDDVGGPWEVVDWKTGRPPDQDDPLAGLQLDLYGLACIEVWGKRPEDLTLTYLYLGAGEERSHPMGDVDEVRARVSGALTSIADGAFDPTPGPWCHHCDFLSFCGAGKARVAAEG
jgi:DNA helicase-2/ATP-dependent DNA helicase PcrA